MPLIEYNKGKIEGYKLEVQEILNALNAPRSFLDDNLAVNERSTLSAPIGPYPHGIATITVFEGMPELRLCRLVQNTDCLSFFSPSPTAIHQPVDV